MRITHLKRGDKVRVILYLDERPLGIPGEIMECFNNEPKEVFQNFSAFTDGDQKAYLNWIYKAKKEDTKTERIVKMMDESAGFSFSLIQLRNGNDCWESSNIKEMKGQDDTFVSVFSGYLSKFISSDTRATIRFKIYDEEYYLYDSGVN